MRFAFPALLLALAACADAPSTAPTGAPPSSPPGPPPSLDGHTLTLPAQVASSLAVTAYAHVNDGLATEQTELSYGLADGYPTSVTLTPQSAYVLEKSCQGGLGSLTWRALGEVQGSGAKLALTDAGALAIELHEEGTVSALLEGEITPQACPSGPAASSIPLRHRVVLHVRRVAGFEVEQFNQRLAGCELALLLPAGLPVSAPTVHPLDAAGQRFEPANAPTPAALTLRSGGELALAPDGYQLSATRGEVAIEVDTVLPVRGLSSFEVVGPEALTTVRGTLYLRRLAAKGTMAEVLSEGASYKVFFPGPGNVVELQDEGALTDRGRLCAGVPAAWFEATSSTPEQCTTEGIAEDASGIVPLASIVADGECRLDVRIPGTELSWPARFRTEQ